MYRPDRRDRHRHWFERSVVLDDAQPVGLPRALSQRAVAAPLHAAGPVHYSPLHGPRSRPDPLPARPLALPQAQLTRVPEPFETDDSDVMSRCGRCWCCLILLVPGACFAWVTMAPALLYAVEQAYLTRPHPERTARPHREPSSSTHTPETATFLLGMLPPPWPPPHPHKNQAGREREPPPPPVPAPLSLSTLTTSTSVQSASQFKPEPIPQPPPPLPSPPPSFSPPVASSSPLLSELARFRSWFRAFQMNANAHRAEPAEAVPSPPMPSPPHSAPTITDTVLFSQSHQPPPAHASARAPSPWYGPRRCRRNCPRPVTPLPILDVKASS